MNDGANPGQKQISARGPSSTAGDPVDHRQIEQVGEHPAQAEGGDGHRGVVRRARPTWNGLEQTTRQAVATFAEAVQEYAGA
jgi:hypothetical protein